MIKTAVIGAGIAGIATSIRLAVKGHKVTVYEKNSYAGGKLTSIEQAGFRFDAGPSLFTMPQFVDELFELAGKNPRDYFNYQRKEVICNYFWADHKRITAYANREKFGEELQQKLGVSSELVDDYSKNAKLKYDLTFPLFLSKSLHKLSSYLSIDTIKAIASIRRLNLFSSLHSVNRKKLREPHLVQFYDRFATYNGSSPFKTPGIMSLIPHLEEQYGTFIPVGGMVSITNSLLKLAEELGVEFCFNCAVEGVEIEENKVKAVKIGGEILNYHYVVSNMDVVPFYKHLLPQIKGNSRVLNQERSSSALIFYWGIEKEFKELDLHNIFFAENYKEEFLAIENGNEAYFDPTVYVNISSKNVKDDAPEGCENWFVMINVPSNTGQDWDKYIKISRKAIIKKLSTILKVDVLKLISCESVLDPRKIEKNTSSYQGALYGSASNSMLSAFLRHPNFSPKVKNLYFCGGSAHPGGGIPLCLLSAKIVSDLIK